LVSVATTQKTIGIVATFTAEPLAGTLRFWLQELGLPYETAFAPYNQVFQQLLDPSSLLAENRGGINVLLIRLEDWYRDAVPVDPIDLQQCVERNIRDLAEGIRVAVARSSTTYCVCICPPSPSAVASPEGALLYRRWDTYAAEQLAASGAHVITRADLDALYPVVNYHDAQGDHNGHIPYSPVWYVAFGTRLARWISALCRPPYKVIAVDCDETLWQGICGEASIADVRIHGPYEALQRFLVAQQENGMLLCLCSKNAEEDVYAVFDRHPKMPLRRCHFVASRINWESKSLNLKSLAAELQLGLDSFIFIDDNPLECAEVEAHCPEVLTILLPQAKESVPRFLTHYWGFDRPPLTAEDRQRTTLYQQNQERQQFRKQSVTLASFLAALDMQVSIHPAQPEQLERIAQLTQRTNQFNTTTQRYSVAELRAYCALPGIECYCVEAKDRFGDYGLIGVMLTSIRGEELAVDLFLLSCRVLGRGIEHKMLAQLGQIACERGCKRVDVHYAYSARNRPAFDFLAGIDRFARFNTQSRVLSLPAEYVAAITFSPDHVTPSTTAEDMPRDVASREAHEEPASATHRLPAELLHRIAMELYNPDAIARAIAVQGAAPRPELKAEFVAPPPGLESYLAGLWQEILGVECIGNRDNFFDLGGDSLRGTILINRLQQRLRCILYIVALFDAPTISEFAAYLEKRSPGLMARFEKHETIDNNDNNDDNDQNEGYGRNAISAFVTARNERLSTEWRPTVDPTTVARFHALIPPGPTRNRRADQVTQNPPAVFLLAPPRSGSTLLRVMLAGHPALFAPPELDLLSFETLQQREATFTGRDSLWLEGVLRAVMTIENCDATSARETMTALTANDLTTQEFYQWMQERIAPRILVDKTPAYALNKQVLARAESDFRDARYIHLLRHPAGMIHSFVEARLEEIFFRHPHSFPARILAELIWCVSQQNVLDFLADIPLKRKLTLKFEDLLANPQEHLQRICQFLQLPYDPAMANPYDEPGLEDHSRGQRMGTRRMTDGLHTVSRMLGDVKFNQHRAIDPQVAERWRNHLAENSLGTCTHELAERLGYIMPTPLHRSGRIAADVAGLSDAEVDLLLSTLLDANA
jgi:FkbH-like protein